MDILNKTFLLRLVLYAIFNFLIMYGWRMDEVRNTGIFWPAFVSFAIAMVGMIAVRVLVKQSAEK